MAGGFTRLRAEASLPTWPGSWTRQRTTCRPTTPCSWESETRSAERGLGIWRGRYAGTEAVSWGAWEDPAERRLLLRCARRMDAAFNVGTD